MPQPVDDEAGRMLLEVVVVPGKVPVLDHTEGKRTQLEHRDLDRPTEPLRWNKSKQNWKTNKELSLLFFFF